MLKKVKILLGIPAEDTSLDERLNLIIENTSSRLKLLLGQDPPEELSYIIVEVSVARFNRIGSEGLSSHSVEGESLTFNDNDFSGYMDEINEHKEQAGGGSFGKLRFL